MRNNQTRYIFVLQVICALAVITLHTNGCFWQYSTERYWFTANIIDSVFYFSVPIFFMITGITLIDFQERYSLRTYFRKRIRKTVLPFLAWSIIGAVYLVATGYFSLNDLSPLTLLNRILKTNIIELYWFFPSLFCVYLCIPIFASIAKDKRKEIFKYILIVGFFINSLLPFIKTILHLDIYLPLSVSVISGYLLYVVGGVYLHENNLTKKQKIVLYMLGLGGLTAQIVGTYCLSKEAGEVISTYKGYNNVPCILYSFAVFVLLRDVGNWIMKSKTCEKIIKTLCGYTFPAYLLHWYTLSWSRTIFHINVKSIFYRLGFPIIAFGIIMGITYGLRKIPLIKHILP